MLGWPKGGQRTWLLNKGFIDGIILIILDFDNCPPNRGWPLNRGSTLFLFAECASYTVIHVYFFYHFLFIRN